MAYDYSKMRAFVTRMLVKYGQSVTISLKTAGTYNNATSTVTPGTPVSATVHALFKRPGLQSKGSVERDLASLIQFGDWDVVLSAEECPQHPKPGDTITRDGKVLIVALADEARPAGTPIAYFCKLQT